MWAKSKIVYGLGSLLKSPHRHLQIYSATQQEVRVRFAPSPTGQLHLGGLRTALYNFLFAKNQDGKFVLRIEDTDQTRLVPGAMENLIEDLLWAGIEIDEGPGSFGGNHGPYIQSQRNNIYGQAVQTLLDNGSAYRCFCTERRLELIRREALRSRLVPRYDNKCRHLNATQIAELLEKQTPYCIRFKLSDTSEQLDDLIYGKVIHNVGETEGDPVIIKTDQYPTYHFANVVDDHFMKITHVLRGVEWQISTPKHLMLYRAFQWQPPKFGHLPLLVNADGTKLSKRQGDIGIKHFRDKGYLPKALINYVVSAGGGFNREPHEKPAIYKVHELAQQFSISKVNAHPSRLNPDLLNDFNRLEIEHLLKTPESTAQLVEQVKQIIKNTYSTTSNLDLDSVHIENILKWCTKRVTFLNDLITVDLSFLWVKPNNYCFGENAISEGKLSALITLIESSEFTKDNLNTKLKQFAKEEKIKYPVLMKAIRSAISGLKEGPGVAEMMEILGKTVVLERIRACQYTKDLNNAEGRVKSKALS